MTNPQNSNEVFAWTGRIDASEGGRARRWHQCVQSTWPQSTAPKIVLLGFAVDAGVLRNQGRIGAAAGPMAIRRALCNMAWHHGDDAALDAGDVVCSADALESAQHDYGRRLQNLLQGGSRPIGLGGGHEIAFASWKGIAAFAAETMPAEKAPRIGIINFDAHFDLRTAERASSGTPFKQIADDCAARGWPFHYACLGVAETANTEALFDTAKSLGVWWELDHAMQSVSESLLQKLMRFIASVDRIYLSVCLDVFPAANAPGVSAPAGFGVPIPVVEQLIKSILQSEKLIYADIAELNPSFDQDQRTAKIAARLVWVLSQ